MESQILMFVAFCGLLSASAALECYSCLRHEVGLIAGGDSEKFCEKVTDQTPSITPTDCKACVMDTYDIPGYDYLKRYCWNENTECESGEISQKIVDIPKFSDPSYKINRKCCTNDKCNNEFWDPDTSLATKVTGSLAAAILVSLWALLL